MREFAVLFISLALLALDTIWVPGESPCWGLCCPAGSSCCWPACPSRSGMPPACFQVFHVPRDWPPPG